MQLHVSKRHAAVSSFNHIDGRPAMEEFDNINAQQCEIRRFRLGAEDLEGSDLIDVTRRVKLENDKTVCTTYWITFDELCKAVMMHPVEHISSGYTY